MGLIKFRKTQDGELLILLISDSSNISIEASNNDTKIYYNIGSSCFIEEIEGTLETNYKKIAKAINKQ